MISSDNTHNWGKDRCSAGLQFNKTKFDQKRTFVVFLYEAKQLNPNL